MAFELSDSANAQYKTVEMILRCTRYLGLSSCCLHLGADGTVHVRMRKFWTFFQCLFMCFSISMTVANSYFDVITRMLQWNSKIILYSTDRFVYATAINIILTSTLMQQRQTQKTFDEILKYTSHFNNKAWLTCAWSIKVLIITSLSGPIYFLTRQCFFSHREFGTVLLFCNYTIYLFVLTGSTISHTCIFFLLSMVLKEINDALEGFDGSNVPRLVKLLNQHEKVWQTCVTVTSESGLVNVVIAILTFGEVLLTTAVYFESQEFGSSSFVPIMLLILYLRISIIVRTVQEGQKTPLLLSLTSLLNDNTELSNHIIEFGLARKHNKYKLDACGFLKLNMTLFTSMLGAATAYGLLIYNEYRFVNKPSP